MHTVAVILNATPFVVLFSAFVVVFEVTSPYVDGSCQDVTCAPVRGQRTRLVRKRLCAASIRTATIGGLEFEEIFRPGVVGLNHVDGWWYCR